MRLHTCIHRLPDWATGPRSGDAGGALREVSGSTTAVGLFTPGGALVVRLASGALQAPSATVAATSIRVVGLFMRSSNSIVRDGAHRRRPAAAIVAGAGWWITQRYVPAGAEPSGRMRIPM